MPEQKSQNHHDTALWSSIMPVLLARSYSQNMSRYTFYATSDTNLFITSQTLYISFSEFPYDIGRLNIVSCIF